MKRVKSKVYVLGMFPYPSGEGLHVGHVRIYTAVDVMARFFRMQAGGREDHARTVLSPIGWDAFGLPAENAAIKAKTNPKKIVPANYANFRKQMQNLDFSFDWEREFATTDPTYYGITQWIFLELYKKGLVYREQVPINWCPKCKTGLANEEVLADGTHERCGEATGKKELPQWVMKITKYTDRLLKDLDEPVNPKHQALNPKQIQNSNDQSGENGGQGLDWPRGILEMQRNWIGKREGTRVRFEMKDQRQKIKNLKTFTTRLDTIYGVTFVVAAPEKAREWMGEGWEPNGEVRGYVEQALQKTEQARLAGEKEKTGADTGLVVVNPANGEEVPVWVADYVLSDVGTGAVMGVPYYDERDRAFAEKFGIEIREIELIDKDRIFAKLAKIGAVEKETSYHLRDWVFSRQRYWGEPIPLVYCTHCAETRGKSKEKRLKSKDGERDLYVVEKEGKEYAVVPLPERDLPLTLPDLESYEPTETGESPLSRVEEWVRCKCPECGGEARRETDTMPNWAGSCWYHLAFSFWKNENSQGIRNKDVKEKSTKEILEEYKTKSEQPFTEFWEKEAKSKIEEWLPVDWYLGGAEHAVLHLLYARFWNKVLQDLGHLDFPEPYLRLRSVGMVLAEDGRKMSKSWGNVINPDEVVKQYGSDAVRLYEMFMGPWDQATAWDSRALVGMRRFLERVEDVASNTKHVTRNTTSPELAAELAKLIKKVEKGIVEQKFNTCIAGMMELVNKWRNDQLVMSREYARKLAAVMSPFAPKTANSIWQVANGKGKAEEAEWPRMSFDSLALAQDLRVTIAVQVNGKLRSTIQVTRNTAENKEKVMEVVMEDERVRKWIGTDNGRKMKDDSEIKKVIFVPGRLVNLVV